MHLVWDWNGTLLDDLALTIHATNATIAAAGGRPITLDEHKKTFRRPLTDFYAEVLGRPVTSAEFAHLDTVFYRVYHAGLEACPLAADVWEALAAWPWTQSVLSMWGHVELVRELDRRGLTGHLARVDGCRNNGLGDLKRAYLAGHLATVGVNGATCVLIGDSLDDADAAAAVGGRCVLYAGGITDPARLRATGYPVAFTLVEAVELAQGRR
ncbi:MAG: HAD family hydrolase [Dactylosporangium sp.]|nr:HAD hydrolase-like protein [Dactylosporangium sp.]NNJ62763.1 HAD family hydrolase [Dactylosporangium sp.]